MRCPCAPGVIVRVRRGVGDEFTSLREEKVSHEFRSSCPALGWSFILDKFGCVCLLWSSVFTLVNVLCFCRSFRKVFNLKLCFWVCCLYSCVKLLDVIVLHDLVLEWQLVFKQFKLKVRKSFRCFICDLNIKTSEREWWRLFLNPMPPAGWHRMIEVCWIIARGVVRAPLCWVLCSLCQWDRFWDSETGFVNILLLFINKVILLFNNILLIIKS